MTAIKSLFLPLLLLSTTMSSRYRIVSAFGRLGGYNSRSFLKTSALTLNKKTNTRIFSTLNNDNFLSSSSQLITYITDIEGDAMYLDRYVNNSKILHFIPNTDESFPYDHCIDFCRHNCNDILVFGGDVCDQGGSDLYVLRQLLDLHRRYPNQRVYFIAGNRDVNKLRMTVEWASPTEIRPSPRAPANVTTNSAEYLKWVLEKTMGSPRAFEYRRQELCELALSNDAVISDMDIVHSYIQSCTPNGEMGQYLQRAQICLKIGSVFFIHGALPLTNKVIDEHEQQSSNLWDDLAWAMPWLSDSDKKSKHVKPSISDWFASLDEFYKNEIRKWLQFANGSRDDSISAKDCGFDELMQYGRGRLPDGTPNPTVIYNSWNTDGMPQHFYQSNIASSNNKVTWATATRDFMHHANITHIICGHQPQGDAPNVIKVDNGRYIICADTSYSGDVKWHDNTRHNVGRGNAKSGRGPVAVCEILIETSSDTPIIYSHGVLSDGSAFCSQYIDFKVGQELTDDTSPSEAPWWIRARLNDGSYLLSTAKGYDVWNRIVAAEFVERQ